MRIPNPVKAAKVWWMGAKLFFKYGPVLTDLGIKVHDKVEELSDYVMVLNQEDKKLKTESKRVNFDDLITSGRKTERLWRDVLGQLPTEKDLERFREAIWKYRNPDKEPRKVSSIRTTEEG